MSELTPPNKTPPNQIGNSKTGGTIQTPQKIQKREELPPGESEPPEVRDKRRQRLLKCLGDNIEKVDLFDDFVESLGVKQQYARFIKDWPDLFLSIARGSPMADSKGILANTDRPVEEFSDFPIADVFKSNSGKLMGLAKEARLVKYFIFLFDAMVNAVRVANRVISAGETPIPDHRLKLKDHQTKVIPKTPHKPDIAFYYRNYAEENAHSIHAILEAKMDPDLSGPIEDTRGQLADYGHLLNDKQATRTFAPVFYLHGHLLTLHAYYRGGLYIIELGQLFFDTGRCTSDGAEDIQTCLMRFWFLLTLESNIFGHFCDVSKKSSSFIFSQQVDVESKGNSKIEVLYSVSQDVKGVKDVKDSAALFCIKETIARYSYMIGRHVHLFRGKFNGKHDAVLKLSWTPVNCLPEGAAYAILNKRPVECIPKIFSSGLLISDLNGYRLEFVLMEYCGQSMAEYLKVKTDNQKAELVPGFVKQLTLCLAQANDTGVLHRDISAGNVCVKNDKVYVIDWGCAKVVGWGTAEDAARDTGPTQLKHIEVAEQWGFNATTVGQVEVAKDPFTGTPLFMGIPMLSSSPIRGILDDLESVFYVVMDAVRSANTKRDDVQGFKFLDSQSLALSRYSIMMVKEKYLELFGIGNPGKIFRNLFHSMRRFLFEPGNQYISHQLWWDSKFVRQANWDAAPEFMHPKAVELLKEDNGQFKRPAEDEINAGSFKKLAL
ncbi:hypothetical protein BX661DRAFT_173553 [Kickxella alabastrina]|uniref:uncharacterized protein n=1 Tax=Kickxella alabastrina TaxID=61397 RepID=UPI002220BF4E|nr:uncharacterized protein BX661DRAFT_173553 [Kickxella alabastrina]KAI7820582.1 hypothetical protein BX661DRAFT_173553 [Kickxella alabastrina]